MGDILPGNGPSPIAPRMASGNDFSAADAGPMTGNTSSSSSKTTTKSQIWALDERRRLFRRPSGEPIQLTSGPIRWGAPIVSRDGKTIYARGYTNRGELVRWDARSGSFQPFLVGNVGGQRDLLPRRQVGWPTFPTRKIFCGRRRRTEATRSSSARPARRWTRRDGRRMARRSSTPSVASDRAPWISYIVPADGGKPRQMLPGASGSQATPDWSPDGHEIVFGDKEGDSQDIRIYDMTTGQVTPVPGSQGTLFPRWSPDGRMIAALAAGPDGLRVFDRTTAKWTTFPVKGAEYPAWSRDGRWIYFLRENQDAGIYRVNPRGRPH